MKLGASQLEAERAQLREKATRLPSSVLREVVERLEAKEAGK